MTQDLDRLKAAFDAGVEAALPTVDYGALYACQVVSQNGDGTLDLQPSSSKLPSQKNIPFRCGIPGVTITVQAGAQVLLGWANGDPAQPYAALWVPGASGDLQDLNINAAGNVAIGAGASAGVARVGDKVTITVADIAALTLIADLTSGAVAATTPIPPGSETTAISTGSQKVTAA